MRFALMAIAAFSIGACATAPGWPINKPIAAEAHPAPAELRAGEDMLALAFSGGGARAASFSYGALLGLRETKAADGARLIDHVALVTAVSGGSITAGWFAQHGADGLDGFRAAALDKDWTSRLRSNLWPGSWLAFLGGGVNGPDRLSGWLSKEVFGEATLGDINGNRPRVLINATELYTGAPFAFATPWFDALCSDLSSVRLADAVAASMAVPLGFRPVVAESFAPQCPSAPAWAEAAAHQTENLTVRETARAFARYRSPQGMKFLHLSDGGVSDNFGLSTLPTIRRASGLPYAPLGPRDAVKVKRLTFLVVNAEMSPEGDWPLGAKPPGAVDTLGAALDDSINAAKRSAYDAFKGELERWRQETIAWRCSLQAEEAQRLGAEAGWDCRNLSAKLDIISFADLAPEEYKRLGAAPTRVSLPKDLIDDLIAQGMLAIEANPTIRALSPPPR